MHKTNKASEVTNYSHFSRSTHQKETNNHGCRQMASWTLERMTIRQLLALRWDWIKPAGLRFHIWWWGSRCCCPFWQSSLKRTWQSWQSVSWRVAVSRNRDDRKLYSKPEWKLRTISYLTLSLLLSFFYRNVLGHSCFRVASTCYVRLKPFTFFVF